MPTLHCVGCQAEDKPVHYFIVEFTTAQTSEDWISPALKKKSKRQSMQEPRDHLSIKLNVTRRVTEADRFKETLHYKNDRSLTFENLLTKCHKINNTYAKYGAIMIEDAKTHFLFNKFQHRVFESVVDAMKAKINTELSGTITFTTVSNRI